jgi:hypothetical protein
VTATFGATATNAVIVVSRYSGVDTSAPLGNVVSANTLGVSGACSGGTDGVSYALSLPTQVDDARVFAAVGMRNREHTPGTGYVQRDEIRAGSAGDVAGIAVVDKEFAVPGPAGVDGSFSGSVDWAVVAVEMRPLLGPAKPATAATGREEPRLGIRHGLGGGIPGVDLTSPRPLTARVRIFDVRGRLVETLWDGAVPAGRKRLDWSAPLRHGRAAAPGIYFVRADIDGRTLTGKLVLLRN